MAKVELTPLRPWSDFFPEGDRFATPDTKDFARWYNRVICNLLYYQTNYLVVSIVVVLIVGLLSPLGMLTAMSVVSGVFLISVWVAENGTTIKNFKTHNPTGFVIAVMVASYMVINFVGSVIVFMASITLPLTFIFAHSSCRLRNIKNKLENTIEFAGFKKSPMGIFLEVLGQQEEYQKIQSFLEAKMKE
ncbi:PRA1 family protein 3-like [Corythoichthys intestinalis]|uniref:PRA1 family protein 3-like n=1 Tax=Corythoichthys intestinalis TaxID=161448 RepID=UPI0025A5684B|nr:PRA1 family protein 3-like [Corythoichthys intestinalis]XP_061814361.1 PRA1 family protein 3-like [Nerophis lumbriciformis]